MEEIFEDMSFSFNRDSLALSYDQNFVEDNIDLSQYVSDHVKILPSKMIFPDAFDGKHFKKSFKIINCGKCQVFVRIFPPSSQTFKMKSLRRGRYLPSGLSVTRTIEYTHNSAMALNKACLFVYINEKPYTYQIEVNLISAHVMVNPKVLNFGEIDVGNASQQLTLELRNLGHRIAQYSVDLGRNDLELIIDPMKGTIMPDGVVDVKVEVLGSQVGSFSKEFWIKTEPPRRVQLTGVFIAPRLVISYPISCYEFTLVDFPKTYYGAECVKTVIIFNYSSTDRMFCLVAESGPDLEYLKIARRTNDDLKCFSLNCSEGRLLSRQNYVLSITFKPLRLVKTSQQYCQAFIRVAEVNYRDGVIAERDEVVKTFTSASSIEEYLAIDNLQEFDDIEVPNLSYNRLCLYGEMEEPSIKLSPEDFNLSYLLLNETYDRILNIKNQSLHLPIVLRSNNVPCVKVKPSEVFLNPEASLEITISITPSEEGAKNYRIIFDLLYHEYKVGSAILPVRFSATKIYPKVEPTFNMGITPAVTNEVGFLVDDIRFNSKVDKPIQAIVDKNLKCFNDKNTDLIAFPNDMPKSLRPWKNDTPCRTIFAKMPRVVTHQDEYTLTNEEIEKKEHNDKVYDDYIKKLAVLRPRWSLKIYTRQDYDLTEKSHLLLEKLNVRSQKVACPDYRYGCIALPPEKLMDVIIKPKYVYLGKIAPYTMCTDSFSIENRNKFSIHVSIKALSNSVVIKGKSRIVIGPHDTKNIFFDCFSHGYGKFYVPVYIIINDNHIFDGTVFASVVPTTVKCDQKEIIINPKTHRSFFELFNPVNCDIKFAWEIQDKNFAVIPDSGVVPSRKNVLCSIMFIPQINATYKTEIYLLSQSGAKQIITVICKNDRATIGFSTDQVVFDNIPLNITVVKRVVLRNFSDEEIMYLVENPNPMEEIAVSPTIGKINAKSDVDFSITALFKDIVSFNCPITFVMQDNYVYTVDIIGNVVFPTVHVTPPYFQIQKVPLGCYQRLSFKMKNTSLAKNVITFHLDDIPEFEVTDMEHKPLKESFTLKPDEVKDIILEFKPVEPIAYSFYLPYKMNNIIGPLMLTDPRTLRPEHYFRTGDVSVKRPSIFPKTIKATNIRCAASATWFTFSSLCLVFNYEKKVKCRKRFTITNVFTTQFHFSVPVVNPKYNFSIKLEKKEDYECTDNSWKFVIEPNETVSFRIEYNPPEYGSCTTELPLYVEEYPQAFPFNYLKLTGVYSRPVITPNINLLYLQSITTKEKVNKKITLKLDFHERDCVVDVDVQHESLSVRFLKRTDSGKSGEARYCSVADYLVKFHPKQECIICAPIMFTCSCDASCKVLIRASADNCIFCSYQSFIKTRAIAEDGKFESTFPFFPLATDKSYYAKTTKVIMEDIERWLFSQGFFYMNFYKIPYGLARLPVDIRPRIDLPTNSKMRMSKTKVVQPNLVLPLVKLLVNLMEPHVTKYFYKGTPKPCYDGIEGVTYVYAVYKNIINFLEAQGVFVSQLKPEYLLPYQEYTIYKEHTAAEDPLGERIFSPSEFLSFTQQVWFDLILKIYRVFLYNRATAPFESQKLNTSKLIVYEEELTAYFAQKDSEFSEDVNDSEKKLMIWLQFHFDNQRSVLWDEKTNAKMANRKIRSFEKDLADSLPFATLMVAYCPYMLKCFDNFFPLYQNEEDIYHNACIIYETWKRLRLSYELRPIRIAKPSVTEMEILVSYLYEVLPNFYPTETITFNASLGDVAVNKLALKNHGAAPIAYTPLFFLNDTEAFAVNAEIVTIGPSGTNNLNVSYKAKSILKKTAILILSGETIGYKFAKTMAFNLVGIPNIFEFTEEYSLNVEVFKQVTKTLEVASPFEVAYEAKLYFFLGDYGNAPETLDEFVSLSSMATQKLPRQICTDSECKFDSDGDAQIILRLCFVACGDYTYFLYFSNREVGDFCIKINFKASFPIKRAVDLPTNLPKHFSTEKCTCTLRGIDMKCPRIIVVDLPSINQQLLQGLKTMFRNCSEEDSAFWSPLLDNAKGFRVLNEYLYNTYRDVLVPFKQVLQHQVTYNVRTKMGKKITIPKSITIDDVTSSFPQRMEIHWNSKQWPENFLLTLVASHEQEIRRYILRFNKPQ